MQPVVFAPGMAGQRRVPGLIRPGGLDPDPGRFSEASCAPLTRAGQQMVEKAAPAALAITLKTLAPLDARERGTLMALLSKLR
jgi:hypothetical protein